MQLSQQASDAVLQAVNDDDVLSLLRQIESEHGGLRWESLGRIDNNVHAVEVASDPAAAIVERVTNAIDAVLDLEVLLQDKAPETPHAAAHMCCDVPVRGVSAMGAAERQRLADRIRVTNLESGVQARPTIVIQDRGTGQHPDAFDKTLLSLMASNKKTKPHQMGVYNAGGAAAYAFCNHTIIVSRRDPRLLDNEEDEIGFTIVRYNPLDPERFKSGTYEYCVAAGGSILRLDASAPNVAGLPPGTHIRHIAYELSAYQRAAHEPKQSLHHLFHAALPDPALPFWVEEFRIARFAGVRDSGERRVVSGLLARLRRAGTSAFSDERTVDVGDDGAFTLRYFVLEEEQEPDAFTTYSQALAFVLNGQRQGTKDRSWIKRNTSLNFLWRRLVILVDCNGLTSAAKREVFSSTRESSKESPLARQILERVRLELSDDDDLVALDEQARTRTLANATRSTSDRVKRQLASQMASALKGASPGRRGGGETPRPTPRPPRPPRDIDDSGMLEIPDTLEILTDPVRVRQGRTAPLRLHVNAKNGFIPRYGDALNVVLGAGLASFVRVRSVGQLLGGELRLTLEADPGAPLGQGVLRVVLVEPRVGLFLDSEGKVEILEAEPKPGPSQSAGGQPDVEIEWIDRTGWSAQDPPWTETTVGDCVLIRNAHELENIVRAEFRLNRHYGPFDAVAEGKKVGPDQLGQFQDAYAFAICWAMFTETSDREGREREADEGGELVAIPDDYVGGERERIARSVLMAMEPALAASRAAEE